MTTRTILCSSGTVQLVLGGRSLPVILLTDILGLLVFFFSLSSSPPPLSRPHKHERFFCHRGIFNSNIAVGDLFKDGKLQIVVPSDVHYICAYFENATSIKSPALYSNKPWGQVGAYTNFADEHRGYGDCSAGAGTTRANFAAGVASIIDVDGDNVTEVVVTGNVHDCSTSPYTDKYIGVFIFKADRTRWSNSKYNWTTVPINTGGILVYDYDVIESVQWNVVVADLVRFLLFFPLFPLFSRQFLPSKNRMVMVRKRFCSVRSMGNCMHSGLTKPSTGVGHSSQEIPATSGWSVNRLSLIS